MRRFLFGSIAAATCGSASSFTLHPPSWAQSRATPRAAVVTLQLGGDFLGDLAKGFQAGLAPKETAREQNEASERLRQAIEEQGPSPEQSSIIKQKALDAKALEAKMARIKAAKAAREASAGAGSEEVASTVEEEAAQAPGGRTTLSAEEGAAMFANIPQPKVLSAEEAQALVSPSAAEAEAEAPAATFGWANTETSPDEAKAAQIRALKEEAEGNTAAKAEDAAAQGGRILSADEEKALFAQAVAQAQAAQAKAAEAAQAKAAAGPAAPAAGFGLAVPTSAQVKSYVNSLAETATAAAPEPSEVRAAAEAKSAKERELSKQQQQQQGQGQPKAWWQQALDAGGKIAAASADAVAEANEKKRAEPTGSPIDPLTSMVRQGSKSALYKQLDQAIDRDDFEAAAAIKRKIDAL